MPQPHRNTGEMLSGGYRYSFNGKEKIDEVSGSGNSIDFGARIYDCRVGRFLNLDPGFQPFQSPYLYGANNPIYFIDWNGEDNIVYLVTVSSGSLSGVTEHGYYTTELVDAHQIALEANIMFKMLGVNTTVVVWEGSYEDFNIEYLDPTDAVAFLGVDADLNVVLEDYNYGSYAYSGTYGSDPLDISPDGDNIITLNAAVSGKYASGLKLGTNLNKAIVFGLVHGTAHLVGTAHQSNNEDYKTSKKVNYAMDGDFVIAAIESGKATFESLFNKEHVVKTVAAHKRRFQPNGDNLPAVDNYEKNKQNAPEGSNGASKFNGAAKGKLKGAAKK